MPKCTICEWFSRKFAPTENPICDSLWERNNNWEAWATNDEDHWWEKPEVVRLQQIAALWDSDPKAAFNGYAALADKGSIHAMIWLGHCHDRGHGTKSSFDDAYQSFIRASDAGSWIATLDIAALLFRNERFDECEACLEEGVAHNFIPAFYWLAWYRIQRSKTRASYQAVKPLLVRAAEEGHPQARGFLAVSMMLGKFGWREIIPGIRKTKHYCSDMAQWREQIEAEIPITPSLGS